MAMCIGSEKDYFAIMMTGSHYWVWDRSLSIREIQRGRVRVWPTIEDGILLSCFDVRDVSVRVCIGERDEVVVFEAGKKKQPDIQVRASSASYSSGVPFVRSVKRNTAEEFADVRVSHGGFDLSLLELKHQKISVEGCEIKVVSECQYNGESLIFTGSDLTQESKAEETVVYKAVPYKLNTDREFPVELLDVPFVRHVKALKRLCSIGSKRYFGAWDESAQNTLSDICVSIPGDQLCSRDGRYLCQHVMMPDGLSDEYVSEERCVLDSPRSIYDAVTDKCFRCR